MIRTRLLTNTCLLISAVLFGQSFSDQALAFQSIPAPSSQTLAPLHPANTRYPLPQHQTLNYIVDWRVFPAGTATIHLDAEGNTERINTTGIDIGAINLLFKVNDRFQSALDRHTGCSQYFNKQLQEGRRQITSSLSFNGSAGQQVLDEKNVVKGTSKHQQAQIPPCVSDLMSAIFYGATQDLAVGQSFVFPVADAMRTINVTMKAEARERVVTPAGTFDTVRVQPSADAGVVKNRGNIWIWYTDDVRHIPSPDAGAAVLGHHHTADFRASIRSRFTGCGTVRASGAAVLVCR